jgi:4-hydroxy-3-methylbut-2-en-1-yl diphosphate reductase
MEPTPTPPDTSGHTESGTLLVPQPRGFCAGVVRAIDVVKIALETLGPPVYVRKEIVHNRHVVSELAEQGAVFVEDLADVPSGAVVIFSAHGVSPAVRSEAASRALRVIDATCPLVTKVHLEAVRYVREGFTVILIGHRDHDEVVGTLGEAPGRIQLISSIEEVDSVLADDPERVAYLTQTTLSVDDTREVIDRLRARFPALVGPGDQDICYATQNRQDAVKVMSGQVDVVIVVGSPTSSNSNRLAELARKLGVQSYMVDSAAELKPEWLEGKARVGLTAGASAPEVLVDRVISRIKSLGAVSVRKMEGIEETVKFPLPKGLKL